jgi:hypothetical protein
MNNANHKSKCAVCRTTNREGNVVRERFDTTLCDWCALTEEGDVSFVRARVGDPLTDQEALVKRARLVPGYPLIPWKVLKEFRGVNPSIGRAADFEWDTKFKRGVEFGSNWKDYILEYTGVVTKKRSQPITYLETPGALSQLFNSWFGPHSRNPKKLVTFFRFRVFHKDTLGYIESVWTQPVTGTPQIDIRNVQFARSKAERDKLFRGVNLVSSLVAAMKGGRQKNSGFVNSNNAEEFVREIVEIGKRVKNRPVTVCEVAKELKGKYGIALPSATQKEAARKGIARGIKEYNPSWTWRDNVLPLIKSGQSL